VIMEQRQVLSMDEVRVLGQALEAREDLVNIAGPETRALLRAPWPQSGPYWRSIVEK
jgi:hypothetical protein